ncbi:hypothetical protein ILUMI_01567 [Ignelater luminosus]|uniref:Lipase n=1 Tax=Ignelater luminosus TaxID=2038154 RepID=A0A8K0GHB0_IGNLU|nr:hypothetical protein ILUMI_01567 [Ignelater luminosus]
MKFIVLSATIIPIIGLILIKSYSFKNNVCKTFDDYYTDRDQNENCYYNPDGQLATPEIIKRWGYPVETHHVTTEDGYILTLFRIPYGKSTSSKKPGKPVLIQHGHKASSKSFVLTGEKSLAFILANAGYDVWLGNFRATTYSSNHTHLNNKDIEFWNFSFHELGIYDVAAEVEYVSKLRKQKIIYIGFSLGTTAATVYSSIYPDIAESKVEIFIQMAPFIITSGMSTYAYYGLTLWYHLIPYLYTSFDGQDKSHSDFSTMVWSYLCYPYPFQMKLCHVPDMWSIGFSFDQINPETFPVTFSHIRETASAKTTTHVSQMVVSEEFRYYDYSAKENLRKYGSVEPPLYNLTNLRVPMYVVRSDNDRLSSKTGVEKFYASLPEHVKRYGRYVVKHDSFNHIDFVFGKDVVPLVYDHLVKFMSNL